MNIIACLFAMIGAALNMFQPVINIPVSLSGFNGSMYDAFIAIVNYIIENGLSNGGIEIVAILIFVILCLVPVIAAIAGLLALFNKIKFIRRIYIRKHLRLKYIKIGLLLCAIINSLVAWGIYYISSGVFSSEFLANYVVPYAQKISFITPTIWAVCYLIAAILFKSSEYPYPIDHKNFAKTAALTDALTFELVWFNQNNDRPCDLDASAFLLDVDGRFLDDRDGASNYKYIVYYNNKIYKDGAVVHTGDDNGEGKTQHAEKIVVYLSKIPSEIGKILFTVTIQEAEQRGGLTFASTEKSYARLVDMNDMELMRHKLDDKRFASSSVIVAAEIHRNSTGGWKYQTIGDIMNKGFDSIFKKLGA